MKEAEEELERQRNAELDAERNEEKKKQEEDQALIQAARAKVLERRRQKQLLDAVAEAPKSSLNISSPSSSVGHDSSGWLSASPKNGNLSMRSPRNEVSRTFIIPMKIYYTIIVSYKLLNSIICPYLEDNL
jgi:hypothetical protein